MGGCLACLGFAVDQADGVAFLFGFGALEQFVDDLPGVFFAVAAVRPVGEGAAGGLDEALVDADVGTVLQVLHQGFGPDVFDIAVLTRGQDEFGIGGEGEAVEFDLVALGLDVQAAIQHGGGNIVQFGFELVARNADAALAGEQVAEGLHGLGVEAVDAAV